MRLSFFTRGGESHALAVGMTGVKMGEQVAQLGCADGGRLGALAKRVGLSGRFVAYVPDEPSASRARQGAANAGVLAEIVTAAPSTVPAETNAFDLVIVDDSDQWLSAMDPESGATTIREALRVLRPGGRLMVIGATGGSGLSRLLRGGRGRSSIDQQALLEHQGFNLVRRLAERDGLLFVEGVKPRNGR